MKKLRIIFCIVVIFLYLSYVAQAQSGCRFVAPDAEEWIENNREKIAKMTRPEWQELEEGYKWIVFTKLSAKQQYDFFRLKIEQVRDGFEWNEEEKEHIDRLYQFFIDNPDLYGEERDDREEDQKFLQNWVAQAMEKLKWTPALIAGIGMDCEDLLDKEGNVRVTAKFDNIDRIKLDVEE